jgi:excisionase family DNA binding protein
MEPVATNMMTIQQVAGTLQVSVETVQKLVQQGKLRATNVGTGSRNYYRLAPSDVESFKLNSQVFREKPGPRPMRWSHRATPMTSVAGRLCG